jgi:hypothetical protein
MALAMKAPMKAATMPTTMVSQIGMGCLPGTTSRPSAPMIAPTMIALMIPVMVTDSSSWVPRGSHVTIRFQGVPGRSSFHAVVTQT